MELIKREIKMDSVLELKNSKSFYGLTKRELEVLNLVIKGLSNREIAEFLHISSHTSKAHVSAILTKLNVQSRMFAVIKAIKELEL